MSIDPFLNLVRAPKTKEVSGHAERAHSKFSASGAERWFNCPGSVELSEGVPKKTSVWAEEGTRAHEVLEKMMKDLIAGYTVNGSGEMWNHALHTAEFIMGLHRRTPGSDVMIETRIYLDFIHPEMFGTFDGAVVDHFGTLHVFDYKYGAGVAVTPKENLQMIFYGIGLAERYQWNFKRARLWIIQPRIKGYDGPMFWDVPISVLRHYVEVFKKAVDRVLKEPATFVEGGHCHWCPGKSTCPLKLEKKNEKAQMLFSLQPIVKDFY